MKIGVLFSAYNCTPYIDKVFEPWLELKDELGLVLAATNARYSLSPVEVDDMKGSHSLLKLVGKKLDFLLHSSGTGELWTEEQGRTYMLNYILDRNVDLIWVIDADESYTKDQILNIINYIKENPNYDSYKVHFKNYVVKYPYWIDGFYKNVIWWTNRHEGIKDFYFDCDVRYHNGLLTDQNTNQTDIPRHIAFVDHYSWLQDDARVYDKIINQNTKYNGEEGAKCAFEYDQTGNLIFNKTFYKKRGISLPVVNKVNISNGGIFDVMYRREENCFYVVRANVRGDFKFKIFDHLGQLLFVSYLSIQPDCNYYINANKPYEDEPFFKIIAEKDEDIILEQEYHLNF